MSVLMKKRYIMKNAKKRREPRKCASTMIKTAKSASLDNVFNQILLIYNGLNLEFHRNFTKPIINTVLEPFSQKIDDNKVI